MSSPRLCCLCSNPSHGQEGRHMTAVRTTISLTILALVMIAGEGRVAPAQLHPPEFKGLRGASFPSMNPPPDLRSYGEGPAWDGKAPDGVQPLPLDMFTSKDFYKDRALWMDKRYYRCNSPRQITDMRSGGGGAKTPPPRNGSKTPPSAPLGGGNNELARPDPLDPSSLPNPNEHN